MANKKTSKSTKVRKLIQPEADNKCEGCPNQTHPDAYVCENECPKKQQKTENPKAISEEIAEAHPDRLEGNPTSDQIGKIETLQKQIDDNQLLDKDQVPLNATVIYNTHYAELVGKAVKANLEVLALNLTSNDVRKAAKRKEYLESGKDETKKGNVKAVVGFITGDQGVFDKIKNMHKVLEKALESHSAVELRHKWTNAKGETKEPLINEKNELLDQRKKLFGKNNSGYLKPLKQSTVDASHTLRVAAKIIGTDKWIITTLQTNDRALAYGWNKAKFYTPFTTYVNVKGEAKQEGEAEDITFNSSGAEDTTTIFRALKDDSVNVDQIYRELTDGLVTPMADLEEQHRLSCTPEGKLPFDAIFYIDGIVTYINTERKDSQGRISMGLMDANDNGVEIKIKLPEWIPITWGEGSKVRVNGKSEYGIKKDGDNWIQGDIQLSAYGVYVYPEEATPAEVTTEQPVAEEAETDAWVE